MEISVTDTGVGIASEDQSQIFDDFRQVGSDYAHKVEGAGLGLTLAKKFVEMHGGTIAQIKKTHGRIGFQGNVAFNVRGRSGRELVFETLRG